MQRQMISVPEFEDQVLSQLFTDSRASFEFRQNVSTEQDQNQQFRKYHHTFKDVFDLTLTPETVQYKIKIENLSFETLQSQNGSGYKIHFNNDIVNSSVSSNEDLSDIRARAGVRLGDIQFALEGSHTENYFTSMIQIQDWLATAITVDNNSPGFFSLFGNENFKSALRVEEGKYELGIQSGSFSDAFRIGTSYTHNTPGNDQLRIGAIGKDLGLELSISPEDRFSIEKGILYCTPMEGEMHRMRAFLDYSSSNCSSKCLLERDIKCNGMEGKAILGLEGMYNRNNNKPYSGSLLFQLQLSR